MYTDQDIANLVARVQQLEIQLATKQTTGLPNTGLVSKNFLTRAFAVWGHYFVSSLLIGIALSCVSLIIGLILGRGALEWIMQLLRPYIN
ncbi:MAG: hypothetical protein FD147_1573 [Chloroflexi bacterium]|nr:MAG: hypothetical protein FD147_1573 [Chloroflexota bacterium]MBA4376191.1 hypothetical protein [Anaerolinea sp.]